MNTEHLLPGTRELRYGVGEPWTYVTVGGLAGYKVTVSLDPAHDSVVTTMYMLPSDEYGYTLYAMSSPSDWSRNQKVFDTLLESFNPGDTKN